MIFKTAPGQVEVGIGKKVKYLFGPGDKGTNWRSSKEELISVL